MVHVAGTFDSSTHKGITASVDNSYEDFLILKTLFFCFIKSKMSQKKMMEMSKMYTPQIKEFDWDIQGLFTLVIDMETYEVNLLKDPQKPSKLAEAAELARKEDES